MNRTFTMQRRATVAAACAMAASLATGVVSRAAVLPYSADANTSYLFHLNEAQGSSVAVNAGTTGTSAVTYNGEPWANVGNDQPTITTALGASGFAGFGNAANLSGGLGHGIGVDVSGNSAFRLDEFAASPTSNDRLADHSTVFGAGNVFTLEAMVNLPSISGSNREIIATDNGNSNNALRGLQFRINSTGNLEFNFIGVTTTAVTTPIPTTGTHAFAANTWFHVAMAYNGTQAQFYWTKVDPSFTAANPVGGLLSDAVDATDAALIVIGNEGRATGLAAGQGSGEGLLGLIDEVRISRVARSADQFIFVVPEPTTATLALASLGLLCVVRRRSA